MSEYTVNIATPPPFGGTEGPDLLRFNVYISPDAIHVYAESREHCDALGQMLANALHQIAPDFVKDGPEEPYKPQLLPGVEEPGWPSWRRRKRGDSTP